MHKLTVPIDKLPYLIQGVRCEVLKLLCQLATVDPEYQVLKESSSVRQDK
jgi:hypothetical protein